MRRNNRPTTPGGFVIAGVIAGVAWYFLKRLQAAPSGNSEFLGASGSTSRDTFPSIEDDRDIVQESSEESFPASDAPSFTPTVALGNKTQ